MAKSKTGKGKNKAKRAEGAGSEKAEKKADKKPTSPELLAAEAAFESGDYNALRKIAAADQDLPADVKARIDELHEMTRTDPQVWAVGVAATVVALIVAAFTLGG